MVAAVEPDRVRVGGDGVIIALLLERGVAAFFCGVRSSLGQHVLTAQPAGVALDALFRRLTRDLSRSIAPVKWHALVVNRLHPWRLKAELSR